MSGKDQRIELPDGRPLLHFHSTPSSRTEWQVFGSDALAEELSLRIICVDRPGLGLSDFDRLGLDRLVADDIIEAATPHLLVEIRPVLPYAASRSTNFLQQG